MAGDMDTLFESVDGLKEDLVDFSIAGVSAVGANIGYGWLESKVLASMPPWVRGIASIAVGVLGGGFLAKWNRNVATGVAVGLAARGVNTLASAYLPAGTLPALQGLGNTDYRLLSPGVSEAPVVVEQVNGLSAATTTVEQMNGLAGLAAVLQ